MAILATMELEYTNLSVQETRLLAGDEQARLTKTSYLNTSPLKKLIR
jgi:hypothetical protein